MKSTKLYENNAYLRTCRAVVKTVGVLDSPALCPEHTCMIIFDQTVFFPEGGGQSCDVGTAAFAADPEHVFNVTKVEADYGQVNHTMTGTAPLPAPGDEMILTIDWEHRFDNMQRHLGEHILSGAFYRLFGAVNKGFHMGDDYMTIDLDFDGSVQDKLGKPHYDRVTWEMAEEAEIEANRVIWADAPVTRSHFDTREEAEKMPLRKKLAFDEDISIVTVGELPEPYDCVACCGTHPSSAGQVGLIKIYKIEPNKGMSRIYLECGQRALRHYEKRLDDMYDIACDMSCGLEDLKEKYEIAGEKTRAIHDRLNNMIRRVVSAEAESIISCGEKTAVRYYDDLTTDDLLSIVKQLDRLGKADENEMPELIVLVCTAENTVILASPAGSADCGKIVKENAPAFSGRGGGKPEMARAMFGAADDLKKFVGRITS